jgi:hypothetical protein
LRLHDIRTRSLAEHWGRLNNERRASLDRTKAAIGSPYHWENWMGISAGFVSYWRANVPPRVGRGDGILRPNHGTIPPFGRVLVAKLELNHPAVAPSSASGIGAPERSCFEVSALKKTEH